MADLPSRRTPDPEIQEAIARWREALYDARRAHEEILRQRTLRELQVMFRLLNEPAQEEAKHGLLGRLMAYLVPIPPSTPPPPDQSFEEFEEELEQEARDLESMLEPAL